MDLEQHGLPVPILVQVGPRNLLLALNFLIRQALPNTQSQTFGPADREVTLQALSVCLWLFGYLCHCVGVCYLCHCVGAYCTVRATASPVVLRYVNASLCAVAATGCGRYLEAWSASAHMREVYASSLSYQTERRTRAHPPQQQYVHCVDELAAGLDSHCAARLSTINCSA